MTLRVFHPGFHTTVQDLGRPGYMSSGVPLGGAFDRFSHSLGNRLLHNEQSAASLEMTLGGGIFQFHCDSTICLAGANAPKALFIGLHENGRVRPWTPTAMRAGYELHIGPLTGGLRAYLCVAGGIQTTPVLQSRSTHTASGLGHPGRPLQAGDELPITPLQEHPDLKPLPPDLLAKVETHLARTTLRTLPANHWPHFSTIAHDQLFLRSFTIADQSDRTGVRLTGTKVPSPPEGTRSEPAVPGTIQVPLAGSPIILGPDGPTIGGYPMPISIIAADLSALAQRRPRDTIRLERTTPEDAHAAYNELNAIIQSINPTTQSHMTLSVHLACDTGEAPPGPARDREHELLQHVSLVHIACGGHAGDDDSMTEAIQAAAQANCLIAAHPAYPDRTHFGRKSIPISNADLAASLRDQLIAFATIAARLAVPVFAVKPHGALYHDATNDNAIAAMLAEETKAIFPAAHLIAPANSPTLDLYRSLHITPEPEAFADRRYEPDGTLRSRTHADATITDPAEAAEQAVRIAIRNEAITNNGTPIPLHATTLCLHADTPNAPAIAAAVRAALEAAGVHIGH